MAPTLSRSITRPMTKCSLNIAVRCQQTDVVYPRISDAAKAMGVLPDAIRKYLEGVRKSPVYGWTFEYAYEHILEGRREWDLR